MSAHTIKTIELWREHCVKMNSRQSINIFHCLWLFLLLVVLPLMLWGYFVVSILCVFNYKPKNWGPDTVSNQKTKHKKPLKNSENERKTKGEISGLNKEFERLRIIKVLSLKNEYAISNSVSQSPTYWSPYVPIFSKIETDWRFKLLWILIMGFQFRFNSNFIYALVYYSFWSNSQ